MARSIWGGAISFGLVNVPVKLYTAVRKKDVRFHQLHATDGARINQKRVCSEDGQEVAYEDIVKGYELPGGEYVTIDDDELSALDPEAARTIDIEEFVDLADIDPIYYDTTYWLAPDGEAATRAYALLVAAMEDKQKVGIGSVVMRNKQHLAAIRPLNGALAMSTMHWADEVVPRSDVDGIPKRAAKASPKEKALAAQIIESLTSEWDPKHYKDTYTDELRDLIERKAKGEEVTMEEPEKSVAEARSRRSKTSAKKARAKKSA